MGYGEGVAWSVAAAVAHTGIDVLRKLGSQRMQPADLVALVTVYDAVLSTLGVLLVDGRLPNVAALPHKHLFISVVIVTASLAVTARLLYQRALSIAPLSLTVPYMAFTPAFVVCISPLFLVGEVPSPLGFLGVFVVSVSGYLLGIITAPGSSSSSSSSQQPCSPSKMKLPVMSPVRPSRGSSSSQKHQQTLLQQHQQQALQQQLPLHLQQPSQQQHSSVLGQSQFQDEWREHNHARAPVGHDERENSRSKSSQTSVWAMAYYKHKTPAHAVSPTASSIPAAPLQLTAAAAAPPPLPWNSSSNGSVPSLGTGSGSSSSNGDGGSSWVDSQAKSSKDKGELKPSKILVARLLQEPVRRGSIRQLVSRCLAALTGTNAGPAMVLTAAFIYSVTASLDKLGIAAADYSLSAYFLGQRLFIGAGGVVYLLCFARGALRHFFRDAVLLFSISLVELGSVVFYLLAIENILVSYVVAIKRINVLLSTLIGCVLFKENVGKRIPYILVMLCGMLLIVLQPGHEDLHHSHHTRHY